MNSFLGSNELIWFNGKYSDYSSVNVPVFSHSLSYATSFYEGIRRVNGAIFKLEEHLDRLFSSAGIIGVKLKYSKEDLIYAVNGLLESNSKPNLYIKILCYLDDASPGYRAVNCKLNIAIGCWDLAYPFIQPIALNRSIWTKPLSASYPYNLKGGAGYLLSYLTAKNAADNTDHYFIDEDGFVCEATGANLIFIKDDILITPNINRCLEGITCKTIFTEVCPALGLTGLYRDVHISEIKEFNSILMCGTAVGVVNVACIDGLELAISKVSNDVIREYNKLVGKS